jgi:xanthine dehydrogenase accessory factor
MRNLVAQLLAALDAGRPTAYCRLVETRGSTPQKAGAAMLVFPDGSQFGTLGGGCVEAEVKRRALGILTAGLAVPATYLFDHAGQLVAQSGGTLEAQRDGKFIDAPPSVRQNLPDVGERPRPSAVGGIAYLPNLERCRLLIVGGGHIGQAVGNGATDLDFDVTVVDDRAEYVTRERFPRAVQLLSGDVGETLKQVEVTSDTYCLIVTRGHNHDEEALFHLIDRGARYVGMIGSKRKIKLIFDDLEAEGISPEALGRVHAPVGIDIGSQTVPEIAVSILAELVAHRNCGGVVPGRPAAAWSETR